MGGNTMKATRNTARHGRGRRRAFTTAFCSMLVFALGLGQAMIPAANADAPNLTMGQVQTSSGQLAPPPAEATRRGLHRGRPRS
jgi:hypothetical protein